jgi:hypothetical protein
MLTASSPNSLDVHYEEHREQQAQHQHQQQQKHYLKQVSRMGARFDALFRLCFVLFGIYCNLDANDVTANSANRANARRY